MGRGVTSAKCFILKSTLKHPHRGPFSFFSSRSESTLCGKYVEEAAGPFHTLTRAWTRCSAVRSITPVS